MINFLWHIAMVLVVCRRIQDNLFQSFGSPHLLVLWLQVQIVTPTLEMMHYEICILLAKYANSKELDVLIISPLLQKLKKAQRSWGLSLIVTVLVLL
jgi:hypothetical protein